MNPTVRKRCFFVMATLVGSLAGHAVAAEAAPPSVTLSGNLTLTNNYVFRGVSQSQNHAAVQGGFDVNTAAGLYAGVWGSNVSWVSATAIRANNSVELDLYGGYKGSLPGDVGYDVGVLQYVYPGESTGAVSPNSTEVYLAASWQTFTLKYSHAVSKHLFAWTDASGEVKTRGSGYIDLSASYPLGDGWGVSAHVGRQKIKRFNDASYTDWKIAVSKELPFATVSVAYTDTNAKKDPYTWAGKEVAKGILAVSLAKTF